MGNKNQTNHISPKNGGCEKMVIFIPWEKKSINKHPLKETKVAQLNSTKTSKKRVLQMSKLYSRGGVISVLSWEYVFSFKIGGASREPNKNLRQRM